MAIKCELCGNTEFIKEDGMFVCKGCNTKYSLEEAKKMMEDANDEKTDSNTTLNENKKLENLRILAERAREENDSITAAKYYEQILLEAPNDWEANFYPIFYDAHNIKIAQIGDAAARVNNIIPSVCSIIEKQLSDEEKPNAYIRMATEISAFYNMLLNNITPNMGTEVSHARENLRRWLLPTVRMRITMADCIVQTKNVFLIELIVKDTYDQVKTICDSSTSILTESKAIYREVCQKEKDAKGMVKAIKDQEKKERIDAYWIEHAEEKKKLDDEQADLKEKIAKLNSEISAIENKNASKIKELTKERGKKLPVEVDVDKQKNIIRDLEDQRAKCGIFKGKEKKSITARIETIEQPKLDELKQKAEREKKSHVDKINQQINALKDEGKELRVELDKLSKRSNDIALEISKDR